MKREHRQVHRWLAKWQKKCLLQSWRFEVEFSDTSHPDTSDDETVFASVVPDPTYLSWQITVYPEFWDLSDEGRERRLLHELVHGPTEALAQMAMRAVRRKQAIREDVTHAEESLVEWFTNVLWSLR